MKPFKILILLFTLAFNEYWSQIKDQEFNPIRDEYLSDNKKQTSLDSAIDNVLVDYMKSPQNSGISIGIIKDSTIFYYNYGETKRNNKTLPSNETLYEIGSLTNTFCGLILAIAINEGKIKLEDDIRKYLPGKYSNLETTKSVIHLKHLANHTSGFPRIPENIKDQPNYDSLNPYKNYDKLMIFEYLKNIKLSHEPGQICEYSTLGIAVLGIILEKVYNKSFDELIKEKICVPNKMNSTGISLTEQQNTLLANGHNSFGNQVPHWDLGGFDAAGGIKSSTSDMIKYLTYNLNEEDASTKLAHQSTFNSRENVALAWQIIKTKFNNQLIWHNGGTFGFSSFCGFIPQKKCALIILSNSAVNVDYIALSILKFLQK